MVNFHYKNSKSTSIFKVEYGRSKLGKLATIWEGRGGWGWGLWKKLQTMSITLTIEDPVFCWVKRNGSEIKRQ